MSKAAERGIGTGDLVSAGKFFPEAWDAGVELGPQDELVERTNGLFTLRVMSPVLCGEDVVFFDSVHDMFGRVSFALDARYLRWKNLGQITPGNPIWRLDYLKSAVVFTLQLDSLLQGDERHGDVIRVLRPHIRNIVRSAYELPGQFIDEIARTAAKLPESMQVDMQAWSPVPGQENFS